MTNDYSIRKLRHKKLPQKTRELSHQKVMVKNIKTTFGAILLYRRIDENGLIYSHLPKS